MHRFLWQSSPCNSRHRTLLTHSSFSQTQLPRPKGCWLVEQLLSPASPLAAFESLVTWLVVFASPAAVLRIPNAKKIAQNCTIVQSTKMKYSIHVCLSNTQSSLMWISSRMSTTHLSTLGTQLLAVSKSCLSPAAESLWWLVHNLTKFAVMAVERTLSCVVFLMQSLEGGGDKRPLN